MPGFGKSATPMPDVTPRGVTTMLRDAGALSEGTVTGVEVTRRLQTTVSNLCFATITYSPQAPRLPNNLLVKWPLEATAAPGNGLPELQFYRELAPALGCPPIVAPRAVTGGVASSARLRDCCLSRSRLRRPALGRAPRPNEPTQCR